MPEDAGARQTPGKIACTHIKESFTMMTVTYVTRKPMGWGALLALLLLSNLFAQAPAPVATLAEITRERLAGHVEYLASDQLEGRKTGSEGNRLAAQYILRYFQENGVAPADSTYLQTFSVPTEVTLAEGNRVSIIQNGIAVEWTPGEDFIPMGFSDNATVSGGLVFVGYGITAKEPPYDDYAGVDVTGKLAVMLRSSPDHSNPHGNLRDYGSLQYKLRNAREHGAVGVIYVSPTEMSDDLSSLQLLRGAGSSGMIALHARRRAVESLLPEGQTLSALEEGMKSSQQPHSFDLAGKNAGITVALRFVETETANVIGMVRGTDPQLAGQTVIVGAHFDHLGWGGEGSRDSGNQPAIHHGADDNASGTAAMMELARRVAGYPLPRSVMFIGFTGEEMGLLGSAYYCRHPLLPLDSTVMMLNLDMVGRMSDNKLNVTGTGTSPRWDALVDTLSARFGLTISKSSDGYGPSDHASFYAQNIPVLNLFSGLHDDYHRPSDTADKINYEGLETVVELAAAIIDSVAGNRQRPEFRKADSSANRGQRATFRVSVGTIPDYSDNPLGLRITGVREGSPAEKAGLHGGDIIIKFGDTPIKNIYDYTYALGKYEPGDQVDVLVLRGEKGEEQVSLKVVLAPHN